MTREEELEEEVAQLKKDKKDLSSNLSKQREEITSEYEAKLKEANTQVETLTKDITDRDEKTKADTEAYKAQRFTAISKGDKEMESKLKSAYDELAIDDSNREGLDKRMERAYQLAGGSVKVNPLNVAAEGSAGTVVGENQGGLNQASRDVAENFFKRAGLDTSILDNASYMPRKKNPVASQPITSQPTNAEAEVFGDASAISVPEVDTFQESTPPTVTPPDISDSTVFGNAANVVDQQTSPQTMNVPVDVFMGIQRELAEIKANQMNKQRSD